MKQKCPICNGCLDFTWIKNRRFFWCDFCKKLFNLESNRFREIVHVVEGETTVERIDYKDDN